MPSVVLAISNFLIMSGVGIGASEFIASTIVGLGTSAGMGMLRRLMSTKPVLRTRVTSREAVSPRRTIYGFYRGPGIVTYMYSSTDETAQGWQALANANPGWIFIVTTMAGHECDSIGDLYLDDKRVLVAKGLGNFGSAFGWYDPTQAKFITKNVDGNIMYRHKRGGKDWSGALHTTVDGLTPLDLIAGTAVEDQQGAGNYAPASFLAGFPSLYVLIPPKPNTEWTGNCLQEGCASIGVGMYRSQAFNGLPAIACDLYGRRVVDPRSVTPPQIKNLTSPVPSGQSAPSGGWEYDGFAEWRTTSGYGGIGPGLILTFPNIPAPPAGARITGLKLQFNAATQAGSIQASLGFLSVYSGGAAVGTSKSDSTPWPSGEVGGVPFIYGGASDQWGLTDSQIAAIVASGTVQFQLKANLTGVTFHAFCIAPYKLTIYVHYENAWQASTVYAAGALILDINGNVQQVSGLTGDDKSGSAPPTWNTATGGTTTDNHVTWTCLGTLADYLEANEGSLRYWSDNAALCWLDYKITPREQGGFGASWQDVDLDSIITAANICDEQVVTAPVNTTIQYIDLINSSTYTYKIIPASMRGISQGMGVQVGTGANAEPSTVLEVDSNSFQCILLNGSPGHTNHPAHKSGESVTAPSGTEARYTSNGLFDWSEEPAQIEANLLSAFAGIPTFVAGKYGVYAGAWRPPSVILTDADLRAPVKVQSLRSARDLSNMVAGSYVNSVKWQPDSYPPLIHKVDPTSDSTEVDNDYYLQQDAGFRRRKQVDLPFTIHSSRALRLASIALEQNRRQKTLTWPGKMSCYQFTPPDVVGISRSRFLLGPATASQSVSEISLSPSAAGAFTVAHGLGSTPTFVMLQMTSDGEIWSDSPVADSTNLHLEASSAGISGYAQASTSLVPDTTLNLAPSSPGSFSVPHGLNVGVRLWNRVPALVLVRMTSPGRIWFTGADGTNCYFGCSQGGVSGVAMVWIVEPAIAEEITVTSSAAGAFTVLHGLSQTPVDVLLQMRSDGAIWFQNPRYDSTSIYLEASDAGVTCTLHIWTGTAGLGWNGKPFQVLHTRLVVEAGKGENDSPTLATDLVLQETDPDVYAWDPILENVPPEPIKLGPSQYITLPVSNLLLESGPGVAVVGSDGVSRNRIKASWVSPPDTSVLNGGHILVAYKPHADLGWIWLGALPGDAIVAYIENVSDGLAYDVQVIAEAASGERSEPVEWLDYTVISASGIGKTLSSLSISGASSLAVGQQVQLKAIANWTDGTQSEVTTLAAWTSSDLSKATVGSATGLVTGVAVGSPTITATYSGKSGTQVETVSSKTAISLSVTGASTIQLGNKTQLHAIVTWDDNSQTDVTSLANWLSSNAGVASVSNSGLVTGVAIGSAIITASYASLSAAQTESVVQVTALKIIASSMNIPLNSDEQLNALATYSDGSQAVVTAQASWSSSNTAVATISEGDVYGVSVGHATISAIYVGITANYVVYVISGGGGP